MISKKQLGHLSAFLLFLIASSAAAQEGFEHFAPLAHGTGRTYTVNAQGLNSAGLNPALLTRSADIEFAIPVLSFGLDGSSSFFNIEDISNFDSFTNDSTRRDFLDLFQGNKLSGRADIRLFGLGLKFGDMAAALTYSSHASTRADIGDKIINFFRTAESSLISEEVSIRDLDVQGLWYNEAALSFGWDILKTNVNDGTESIASLATLSVGGAIKYITGIGYMRLEPTNYFTSRPLPNQAIRLTADYSIRYSYVPFLGPSENKGLSFSDAITGGAGSGIGFDLGALGTVLNDERGHPLLRIGSAVTDIGRITWRENTYERSLHNFDDSIYYSGASIESVNDTLQPLQGDLHKIGAFSTDLPTTFRLGAALNLSALGIVIENSDLTFSAEYAHGLTDVVGAFTGERLGAGVSWVLQKQVFRLRTGLGYWVEGDRDGISVGAGIDVASILAIDVATSDLTGLFLSKGRRDVAFGVKLIL